MKNHDSYISEWMNMTEDELKSMVSFRVPQLENAAFGYTF